MISSHRDTELYKVIFMTLAVNPGPAICDLSRLADDLYFIAKMYGARDEVKLEKNND